MFRLKLALIVTVSVSAASSLANDWPYWRGPEQTGFTREPAPVTTWSEDNIVWKLDDGGRTTPIVWNNKVYAIIPADAGTPKSGERVVCWDADTGKEIWEHRFPVYLTDVVENRVGWNSVVADPETGNIYAHGTGGDFFCYNGENGDIIWKHSLTEEYGRISGYGGRIMTPIVDEDRVIISFLNSSWGSHAKPSHRNCA
ncbi:MAG: PQQ-binding-like beta-propeller repeat protein, partial [Phycisphaerae bacterium]